MKKSIVFWLVLLCTFASAQNITKLEYFVDEDPGFGSATNVAITPAPVLTDFKFNVPVTSLKGGLHTLYVRLRDANNKWSYTRASTFVKLAARTNVNRVEYFVDEDPGVGNGTSVAFKAGNALTDLTFNVPLNSLSVGLHTLYVRIKDASGRWSLVQKSSFVKVAAPPAVTRVEYFIDTDPGIGNATSVPITPAPVLTDLNFSVDVSTLSAGSHKIYVRVQNSLSNWSILYSQSFDVCNAAAPLAKEASEITGVSFMANWVPAAGATKYRLDVSKDDFATMLTGYDNKEVTGTSLKVTGLELSTTYKYRLRAVGVCTSINSNEISVTTGSCAPPATPTVTLSGEFSEQPVLTSNASAGNQWYRNNTLIPGETGTTLEITEPGVYKVQVVNGECISEFSMEVSLVITGLEAQPLQGISLYPNPVSDELVLYGAQHDVETRLVDTKGMATRISLVPVGDKVHQANVSQLRAGMYLLMVKNGNAIGYVRFIKK